MDGAPTQKGTKSAVDEPVDEVVLGGSDVVNGTPAIARQGTIPGSAVNVLATTRAPPGVISLCGRFLIAAVGIILAYAAGMLR